MFCGRLHSATHHSLKRDAQIKVVKRVRHVKSVGFHFVKANIEDNTH